MALQDAWRRTPVISVMFLPNFIIVCKCFVICSINKFGIFRPPHCHGPRTIALGNVQVKPAAGRPAMSMGLIIVLHSVCMNVVAMSGYSSFWRMTWHNPNSATACVTLAADIDVCQLFATSLRYCNSSALFLSGASHTPRVLCASNGDNCGILVGWEFLFGTCMPCVDFIVTYCHFPLSQVLWMKYQKHFLGTSVPPVALSRPTHILIKSCIHLTTCLPSPLGSVMHRSTSSTKPKPAMLLRHCDIVHIMWARNPS